MKRLFAFLLACVLLCACSACKKESPPAPEPAQTAKTDPEQTISGLSVRIPATQYRLGRTEPELLDLGEHLLPYDKGAVLTGMIFAQDEAENDTEAAAFYAPDRSCVVQTLAVSPDGRVVQAALDGERLFSLEAAGEDGTQWALHGPDMEASLDAALTGCSNITAMAVREDTVYLAADGACVLACSLDGMLLWKQEAPAIARFFSAQDGRLLAWARQEQVLYLLEDGAIRRLCSMPDLFCTGIEQLYPGDQTPYDCIVCANDAFFGWSIAEEAVTQLFTCDAVGLYAGDVLDFCSLGNDRYLGFEWAPSASGEPGCTLFWLTPVEGKLPEKCTIRVAGSRSSIFSMAVRDFSSLYPEYQVEFVDYEAQYGEQADQQLLMDLLYGQSPDLLFVNCLRIPRQSPARARSSAVRAVPDRSEAPRGPTLLRDMTAAAPAPAGGGSPANRNAPLPPRSRRRPPARGAAAAAAWTLRRPVQRPLSAPDAPAQYPETPPSSSPLPRRRSPAAPSRFPAGRSAAGGTVRRSFRARGAGSA